MKSINIPFSFSNGGVSESSDIAIITQNKIVDVLITNSAERAINTSYGVGIQSLLYESIDSLLFDDFKSEALVKINEVLDTGSVLDISIAQEDLIQTAFV
jgi:phage baseplate assembly protein W